VGVHVVCKNVKFSLVEKIDKCTTPGQTAGDKFPTVETNKMQMPGEWKVTLGIG